MGTHVRLTRSGGLAGIDMVASVDVDSLPADEASRLRDALAGIDFDRHAGGAATGAPGAGGPPMGADRYQYDLEVEDGGKRALTAHEPDVSPPLKTVIDVLLPRAQPQ